MIKNLIKLLWGALKELAVSAFAKPLVDEVLKWMSRGVEWLIGKLHGWFGVAAESTADERTLVESISDHLVEGLAAASVKMRQLRATASLSDMEAEINEMFECLSDFPPVPAS